MVLNTSGLEEESSSINRQSVQIAQISDELGRLAGGLDDGGGMELIKIHLRHIAENLETDARKANLLSDLLGRISGRYARTEREIADAETMKAPPTAETIHAEAKILRERETGTVDMAEFAGKNTVLLETDRYGWLQSVRPSEKPTRETMRNENKSKQQDACIRGEFNIRAGQRRREKA